MELCLKAFPTIGDIFGISLGLCEGFLRFEKVSLCCCKLLHEAGLLIAEVSEALAYFAKLLVQEPLVLLLLAKPLFYLGELVTFFGLVGGEVLELFLVGFVLLEKGLAFFFQVGQAALGVSERVLDRL
jgi:hypothetical protein